VLLNQCNFHAILVCSREYLSPYITSSETGLLSVSSSPSLTWASLFEPLWEERFCVCYSEMRRCLLLCMLGSAPFRWPVHSY
jgi:hypothetical protein